jgi:hypothetical protein
MKLIKQAEKKRWPQMERIDELLNQDDELAPIQLEEIEQDPTLTRLTYKQKLFCLNYIRLNFDGTKAALASGYADSSAGVAAHRLLQQPDIQLYILKRQQAIANAAGITREYVLAELAEIIEEVRMQAEPDRQLQLKALDMINRLAGFYQPDTLVNVQNNVESIKIEIVRPNEGIENTSDTSI